MSDTDDEEFASITEDPHKQILFAFSKNQYIRMGLACNKNLHIDVQYILAKDNTRIVRSFLAENQSISDDIQLLLIDEFGKPPHPLGTHYCDIPGGYIYGPKTKAYLEMKKILNVLRAIRF